MKQKIYDIPLWEAYGIENCECPLCIIEKQLEKDSMDILFDDMLMTPYFGEKLQKYSFCNNHYRKLYIYKDKLGLALLVNNLLICQKDELKSYKGKVDTKKKRKFFFKKKASDKEDFIPNKPCYLCEKLDENMPDYIDVLFNLWNKNKDFKELYSKSKGHCMKHFNMLMESSNKDFKEITLKIQVENEERLLEELDWFVSKFDYRFQNEPWKNSKDALPRSINKLVGNFYEE